MTVHHRLVRVFALIATILVMLPAHAEPRCPPDNAGLTLPAALCATVFADNLGQARHLVVANDGTVYVNTWRSPYRREAALPGGSPPFEPLRSGAIERWGCRLYGGGQCRQERADHTKSDATRSP